MVSSGTKNGASAPSAEALPAWARVALDVVEKAIIIVLFAWLCWSVFTAVGSGAPSLNLVLLAAEGLNVVFILLHTRASVVSYRPVDWLVSIGAATGPLLARPAGLPPLAPPVVSAVLLLGGLIVQVWSKLSLRRSFGLVPANRGLKISGPYHFVRHPMYLGYLTGWIGFFMINPSVWNLAVYVATLLFLWRRLEGEEQVLALDPGHAAYRHAVKYRLIPGVW